MIPFFNHNRKCISITLLIVFILELLPVSSVYALTSGPSQPEVQSFQPAGTSDMVDLFSGDFSYNIPLFELPGPNGGYPFNLSYQSGIGLDQEASWVGLGWNLQPGAINRQMRGLPDEFNGTDQVQTKMSIDKNVTLGLGAGIGVEVFGADGLSLNLGFSVYQNNYRGMGYSIDGSLGFGKASSTGSTIGLGFSIDSNEGVNLSPSISLGNKNVNFGLGIGYSSRQGLTDVSLDVAPSKELVAKKNTKKENMKPMSTGANISFVHPGYTPQITMPMSNTNISVTLKAGASWWGFFGAPYVTGFHNEQRLVTDKKWVSSNAYGYLNYQNAKNPTGDLLDMNREKDGVVTRESPNIAIPSLTYDIYSVNGQGISAMYRPMRNDYGFLRDQEISSESTGGSAGVDLGAFLVHAGLNLSLNHSKSTSGAWNNSTASKVAFSSSEIGSLYEPWYFKAHGEPTAESIQTTAVLGGEKAMRVKLDGIKNSVTITDQLQSTRGETVTLQPIDTKSQQRKLRNQTIQPYTNEQILNGTKEMLPHFQVKYLDKSLTEKDFDRTTLPPQHITAFTALTPEGLRYNYGIPAYNLKQEEVTFSAQKKDGDIDRVSIEGIDPDEPKHDYPKTEKYLRRVKMPKYAHSYLLTSIVGPDYVDVTGDGVSVDDLGYWVKFTYQKTTSDAKPTIVNGEEVYSGVFKWRDPFSRAHLQAGWKSDPRDDKGSFTYGEKELWYLKKAETKSHIADFIISQRDDGKGVQAKLQESDVAGTSEGNSVYRLDEIRLYTRLGGSATPIKVTRFDYDYSLCQNVFNSTSPTKGKLTLKRLWFEYGGSNRGSFNPYEFTYESSNPGYCTIPDANKPDQKNILNYDRWGNYKPNLSTSENNIPNNFDFPYVNQDPNKKADIDTYAASWSMTQILLPSGGKVIVDYESDDYAYVQHKQAMQMVEVVNPYVASDEVEENTVFVLRDENLGVRFKLEKPFDSLPEDPGKEILKYVDASSSDPQLYFKFLMSLRTKTESYDEYISGYVDIDLSKDMGMETDATGKYAYGYFYVKPDNGSTANPFSLRAWQHLRTNQPELANSGAAFPPAKNNEEKVKQIVSVGSIIDKVKEMFDGGFYNFCKTKEWGRQVQVGKSWIRLKSPDKIKYGGGLRVKQITMKDNWSEDKEGIYGQVYDYNTKEGDIYISSGVASYEPFVGGEENPIRNAKKYTQSVPLRADNNLFFEYPVNESYYPGAQVGYSKVSVLSLASASLLPQEELKKTSFKKVGNILDAGDGKELFPKGSGVSYGTSGKTVHEFFTAKDFPVISDETEIDSRPYMISVPVPFLGTISANKLTASQGYSIVTNDMHGKQKKVSNYRQDKLGNLEPEPISWVKYNYAVDERTYQGEKVFVLKNSFAVDPDNPDLLKLPENETPQFTLGQESEFFMDMRQFQDDSWTGGVRINVDILFFFFFTVPAFVPWPSIGQNETQLRTAVTNKVIFKSGIMESVEAFDGGSLVKTKNERWDKKTGSVVLTSVNNNFDKKIYSYNILAHTKYQGMGAAYQNMGLTFSVTQVQAVPNQTNKYQFKIREQGQAGLFPSGTLYPGDEMLLYANSGSLVAPVARVVYTGEENGINMWYSEKPLTLDYYKALIVRSGYRNQLSVSAGNITALEDPSKKTGMKATFSKTIQIPK